ncbi:hypothetical protein FDUTEX481_00513 [Tolypothrix sp. PCC 7601]|nr:hypothetical protein FDUTEX481_00513 [Tolypothrix sp. PCC 7601]
MSVICPPQSFWLMIYGQSSLSSLPVLETADIFLLHSYLV